MEKKRETKGILTGPTANILNQFGKKIKDLFRLEEVEVTFTKSGYTYTKTDQK